MDIGKTAAGELLVRNGGTVDFSSSTRIGHDTFNGKLTVTGSGSHYKSGTSYIDVGNDNATGDLTVSSGGLIEAGTIYIADDDTSTGTVTITGVGSVFSTSSNFRVGDDGKGIMTVSDSGIARQTDDTRNLVIGRNVDADGTLVIGAVTGQAATNAGTVDVKKIEFGDGTGKITFNHTETNYTFNPDIIDKTNNAGNGTVEVLSGTTAFSGTNTYAGATSVQGGKLLVNGSLSNSTTTVNGSGTVGGTGTLGSVIIGNGGTFAPGNSIGTLNTGDVTFNSGSRYVVEVNKAGSSDRLVSTGTVTINPSSTLHVTPENAGENGKSYNRLTSYDIIQATSISGTFSSITDDFAFLDAEAKYTPTKVTLDLKRNDVEMASKAKSPNQKRAAEAVDTLGTGNPVYDAAVGLSSTQAPKAFAQLAGEVHTSKSVILAAASQPARTAGLARAGNRSTPGMQVSPSGSQMQLGYAAPKQSSPAQDAITAAAAGGSLSTPARNIWAMGIGTIGRTGATSTHESETRRAAGFLVGVDGLLVGDWNIGMLAGYQNSNVSIDTLDAETNANSLTIGAYGGRDFGSFGISFGTDLTWHFVDADRSVVLGTNFSEQLTSNYNAATAQLYGEASYGFTFAGADLQAFSDIAQVIHHTPGFSEKGGTAALTYDDATQFNTITQIGLRSEVSLTEQVSLQGSIAWRHTFGSMTHKTNVAFANAQPFNISSTSGERDAAIIGGGMKMKLSETSDFNFSSRAELTQNSQDYTVMGRFGLKF